MENSQRNNKKQIVVTGGTGFIGRCFLHRIRHHHLDVLTPMALVRPTTDIVSLERLLDHPSPVRPVRVVDFSDVRTVTTAIHNADIIVHLAADMDFFPKDEGALFERNVSLTRTMVTAATIEAQREERTTPLRFVYVSSTEAIGPTTKTGADESSPHHPTSAYGRSKSACEAIVEKEGRTLEVVVARLTGVFGPGERFFFYEMCKLIETGLLIIGPSPMTGSATFTHVDDVVTGLILLCTDSSARGIYNVSANDSLTYRDLIGGLCDSMGRQKPVGYLPLPLGKAVIRLVGPIMNWGKKRTFVLQPRTLDETMEYRVYRNDRLKALGFSPKHDMISGVKETVKEELRTGGLHVTQISPVCKRGIQFVSVVLFFVYTRFRCDGKE